MRAENVTFKVVDNQVEPNGPNDDGKRTMEVIEISYPDGKVVAYPADHISPETGKRYRDMFADKYKAFKAGEPDPDRRAALEREIADRQEELKGLSYKKAPDDERIQENLGYGSKSDNKYGKKKSA